MSLITTTRMIKVIDHRASGERMRQARLLLNLSLREVARRMDLSACYVSDLERGNRNWTEELATRYEKALQR